MCSKSLYDQTKVSGGGDLKMGVLEGLCCSGVRAFTCTRINKELLQLYKIISLILVYGDGFFMIFKII